jgi:hypothetical protein
MRQPSPDPALGRLEALVGEWTMQPSLAGRPIGSGRTVFQWLEGGAFLAQHADAEPAEAAPAEWVSSSPFPLVTIIGLDDASGQFSMLYADARGVLRVYQMTLRAGVWKLWRDTPGFFQRFTGTFSDDGTTISGRWEASEDGSTWDTDFDMTYTKVT